MQPWAGSGWGFVFIPRIGMEVLVDFVDGDPDRPLVIGSVFNGEHPLPYALPGEKTKSTIKTESSLGGGGFNELRFEDKKGSEEVFTHAQKDQNEVVENDHTTTVHHDQRIRVDNDQSQEVGNNQTEHVFVDQDLTVDANRTITVHGNFTETIDGSETRTVSSGSTETIDAGETRTVTGGTTETISGGRTQTINGGSTETINGSLSQSISGGATITTPASYNLTATGGLTIVAPAGTKFNAQGGVKIVSSSVTTHDLFFRLLGREVNENYKDKIEISGLVLEFYGFRDSVYAALRLELRGVAIEAIVHKDENKQGHEYKVGAMGIVFGSAVDQAATDVNN
jgi:type VI secretion system secreted protein VgrG